VKNEKRTKMAEPIPSQNLLEKVEEKVAAHFSGIDVEVKILIWLVLVFSIIVIGAEWKQWEKLVEWGMGLVSSMVAAILLKFNANRGK
jgi:hypothetical protein